MTVVSYLTLVPIGLLGLQWRHLCLLPLAWFPILVLRWHCCLTHFQCHLRWILVLRSLYNPAVLCLGTDWDLENNCLFWAPQALPEGNQSSSFSEASFLTADEHMRDFFAFPVRDQASHFSAKIQRSLWSSRRWKIVILSQLVLIVHNFFIFGQDSYFG